MLAPEPYGFLDPLPGHVERCAMRRLFLFAFIVTALALIGAVTVLTWLMRLAGVA